MSFMATPALSMVTSVGFVFDGKVFIPMTPGWSWSNSRHSSRSCASPGTAHKRRPGHTARHSQLGRPYHLHGPVLLERAKIVIGSNFVRPGSMKMMSCCPVMTPKARYHIMVVFLFWPTQLSA